MGMSPKEYARLTGQRPPKSKAKKKSPQSCKDPGLLPDECSYCDEEMLGAKVTDLYVDGVYHAKCIALEKLERIEYERVKDGRD